MEGLLRPGFYGDNFQMFHSMQAQDRGDFLGGLDYSGTPPHRGDHTGPYGIPIRVGLPSPSHGFCNQAVVTVTIFWLS